MEPALLDTDTLSEIMKGRNAHVQDTARQYLATFGHFTFSRTTRYEILRGLKARGAVRQLARFEQQTTSGQFQRDTLGDSGRMSAGSGTKDLRRDLASQERQAAQ